MKYLACLLFCLCLNTNNSYGQTFQQEMIIVFKKQRVTIRLNEITINDFIGLINYPSNSVEEECKSFLSCQCKLILRLGNGYRLMLYPIYKPVIECDPLVIKSIINYYEYFIKGMEVYDVDNNLLTKKCTLTFENGQPKVLFQ